VYRAITIAAIVMFAVEANADPPSREQVKCEPIEALIYGELQANQSLDDAWLPISITVKRTVGKKLIHPIIVLKGQPGRPEVEIIAKEAELWTDSSNPGASVLVISFTDFTMDIKGTASFSNPGTDRYILPIQDYVPTAEALKRGIQLQEKGDFDGAIREYTEAIRLSPKCAKGYCMRGIAWKSRGNLDKAISDQTEAIRLKPKYAEAYRMRGIVQKEKGSIAKAIADLSEAIRLDPKCADAYYNRGWAYSENGDKANAEADFSQAKKLGYKKKQALRWF
jgi:tetratricopeptide (TPR) repeat protein